MPYQIVHPRFDDHPDKNNWIGIISELPSRFDPELIENYFHDSTDQGVRVGFLSASIGTRLGWNYVDGFVIDSLPTEIEPLKWLRNQIIQHKNCGKAERRANALQE